jgi:hypothetical protein
VWVDEGVCVCVWGCVSVREFCVCVCVCVGGCVCVWGGCYMCVCVCMYVCVCMGETNKTRKGVAAS